VYNAEHSGADHESTGVGEAMTRRRALTGIKPTGTVHLGNYLGAIKPAIGLTDAFDAYYFIANYHALTSVQDPQKLRQHTLEVAAAWLACGLNPQRSVIFRQTDVPEVTELAWILSCVGGLGMLERSHSVKDARAKGMELNIGTFTYPVLMAADILAYGSNVVPVGKDQKQHVEITRDLALAFNHRFGDTLTIPEARIRDQVATIPGLDGQKMSKSYDNIIPLFAPAKRLRKLIMKIKTDSLPVEASKIPENCNVFQLYRHFSSASESEALAARYRAGNLGYGEAKQELFEAIEAELSGPRVAYETLLLRPDHLEEILVEGGKRARSAAAETLESVRFVTGL
jgi:tryptophanyl-tRNA synthetase